jgi:hypothetical protein
MPPNEFWVQLPTAIAGFVGVLVGAFGTFAVTWLTKHYEEKKARRELRVKIAFDYWQTTFKTAQDKSREPIPFEAFFLHALHIIDLAERKNLSQDQFLAELDKLQTRHAAIIANWTRTHGRGFA